MPADTCHTRIPSSNGDSFITAVFSATAASQVGNEQEDGGGGGGGHLVDSSASLTHECKGSLSPPPPPVFPSFGERVGEAAARERRRALSSFSCTRRRWRSGRDISLAM